MIKLSLTYNQQYTWTIQDNIAIIGTVFLENKLLNKDEFILYFKHCTNEDTFTKLLKNISGHYAVTIQVENVYFIAVDTIRTFPLFITKTDSLLTIADNPNQQTSVNKNAEDDFEKIYCAQENDTLFTNTQQLQAGEYAKVDSSNNKIEIKPYYKHASSKKTAPITDDLISLENGLVNQIKQVAKNKTILIPLSGGYDSRYLVALLKQHDITNIECFTYGKKDSYEVTIAKNVAEKLNYKWHFIEYTDELLNSFFEKEWEQYAATNHHYSSLPHEQDFFALLYMKRNNLLPKNGIIINGFCQDLHAGSIFEPIKKIELKNYILQKYHVPLRSTVYENNWNGYQEWFIKNRVSKFIINSVHVYTYFGLDFYLPFWNKNWIDFWYDLSFKYRVNQQFYNDYLFNGIFKKYDIKFKKPNHDSTNYLYTVKKIAKAVLPTKIIDTIQDLNSTNSKNDANNTLYLYHTIHQKINKKPTKKDFNFNHIHALYFIEKLNLEQNEK